MFTNHYVDWTNSRMKCINKYLPDKFFNNKTLLELGAGHGHNGNKFANLGAIVTSSDARQEHITDGKKLYPNTNFLLFDCDRDKISKKYDIILHWGLLYHLNDIENHLEDVCKNCDFLILETEVADSDKDNFFISTNERGYDQAFNGKGIRPSPSYVEKVLLKNNFDYRIIKDSILNSNFHIYDWEITNNNSWRDGLRRFWFCWKKDIDISFNI
jgi:hypothetical protein